MVKVLLEQKANVDAQGGLEGSPGVILNSQICQSGLHVSSVCSL